MTIDEAKRVRIVDFLAQLGHRAQYMKSEQYWYLSPLRKEVTPSFKVNDRLNEWYDFGEATGGDLVELGKYLCGTKSVSEALAYIKRYVNGVSLPKTRALPATSRPVEADMKNLIIVPLRHHALLSYLHSRMIDSDIGRISILMIVWMPLSMLWGMKVPSGGHAVPLMGILLHFLCSMWK